MAIGKGPLVLGPALVASGMALLAWAAFSGDADLYLVLAVPVFTGSGPFFALGAVLLLFGIVATFLALAMRTAERVMMEEGPERPSTGPDDAPPGPFGGADFGGVIFLGPVPIVFGKGQRIGPWMMLGSIVFAILLIVFFLGLLL